jgi:cytochrome c551/c552
MITESAFAANDNENISYEEQIKPIFRQHCIACHGEDKKTADLNLQTYATVLKGGSGGEAVIAGRASQSPLFKAITDPDDDARMPPKKPPIPKEQIALIQKWIDSGLKETASSKSLVVAREMNFKPSVGIGSKAPVVMPETLPEFQLPKTLRPLAVLTMDASPWAPLVAVAGQEHVRLVNVETHEDVGRLPFPEGVPHVIRFSRDGGVIMVAGGRPVQSGKVVLFDVKTGKRLAAIGDEVDSVMAADLSPDQQLVALGGSGKVVKVYSTTDGQLKYKIEKHTDWITAVAFSPSGERLATADRAGGIHLWEATTGRVLLALNEHKSSVRALDWRSDSNMLASAGEDGLIVWWSTVDGFPAITKPNSHPPARPAGRHGKLPNGVIAARFDREGNLTTVGRDHTIRLWNAQGVERKAFSVPDSQPLSAAISFDTKTIIGGDSSGGVHFWSTDANAK